jgi:hypothetical protein
MRPKVAASLVVIVIAALPACSAASKVASTASKTSSTTSASGPGATQIGTAKGAKITVKPATGHSHTHVVVTFTAPERTGQFNGAERRYVVGANAQQRQGCVAGASKSVGASRAGARVSVTLTPVGGGGWCTGTFRGKIIETTMPRCAAGKVCPAFIGVLRTIGTFKFRVEP